MLNGFERAASLSFMALGVAPEALGGLLEAVVIKSISVATAVSSVSASYNIARSDSTRTSVASLRPNRRQQASASFVRLATRWLFVGLSVIAHRVTPLDLTSVGGEGLVTSETAASRRRLTECFTLKMTDAWGDGWNGALWTWAEVPSNTVVDSGTLESGASGTAELCGAGSCYNLTIGQGSYPSEVEWSVEDESGQEVASGGDLGTAHLCAAGDPSPQPTAPPAPAGECFTLKMTDAWGDGWNGALWTWAEVPSNTVVDSGTLESGASGTAELCGAGSCYNLTIGQGSYPSEVEWSVEDESGQEVASGGDLGTAHLCAAGAPSRLPTVSPAPTPGVPTISQAPSPVPTITPMPTTAVTDVSSFSALSSSIRNNAQINVVSNITITAPIEILGKKLTIGSSTGAVLTADRHAYTSFIQKCSGDAPAHSACGGEGELSCILQVLADTLIKPTLDK